MKNFYALRAKIADAIQKVEDPELFVSVVDLGLLYNIRAEKENIIVEMTLTTMGCPLFDTIQKDVEKAVQKILPKTQVKIELVFNPPWSLEMVAHAASAELGI